MGRGRGQVQSRGLGQGIDGALALGEQIEQLQAFPAGQRLAAGRERVVQPRLRTGRGGSRQDILHKSME